MKPKSWVVVGGFAKNFVPGTHSTERARLQSGQGRAFGASIINISNTLVLAQHHHSQSTKVTGKSIEHRNEGVATDYVLAQKSGRWNIGEGRLLGIVFRLSYLLHFGFLPHVLLRPQDLIPGFVV